MIVGLTLSSLIISYLIVWTNQKKNRNEPLTSADKLAICVFSFWAIAILLDVLFVGEYTFTVVKGLRMKFA